MSRRRPSRFHGLLPVYKQAGPTSHDVVDMARKALRERRIGHTGTLDPMATEIAEEKGLTVDAVRMRVKRAVLTLGRVLGDLAGGG